MNDALIYLIERIKKPFLMKIDLLYKKLLLFHFTLL